MAKIGRNAPCPCSSGKKYKKCCMMKRQTESFTRSLVHHKIDALIPEILEYTEQNYSENVILEAWSDFYGQDTGLKENPYADMFIKWFLFLWIPEEAEESDGGSYPSLQTIGAHFLKARKHNMDSLSIKILEASLKDPLSFWQVEAVEDQRGVLVKDLLLGRECFVEDITGSEHLKKWDILLASMHTVDGIHVFNITSPFVLPPNAKTSIQEAFSIDPASPGAISQLFECDLDLIIFYQDVIDELFAASMPEVRNMDGKELIFTKSVYLIDPAIRNEIIDILSNAETFEPLEENGPSSAKFLWNAASEKSSPLEIVIKGHLQLGKKRLITECNSAERDNQLRKILQDVLGTRLTHQQTTSDPIDYSLPIDNDHDEAAAPLNLDELPREVRDQLTKQLENMYLQWTDQSIPALEHQTPRQAVQSAEGRAKVIGLINDWENQTAHMKDPQFRFDFNRLRDDLGLPRE
jgi:SEC-C motif